MSKKKEKSVDRRQEFVFETLWGSNTIYSVEAPVEVRHACTTEALKILRQNGAHQSIKSHDYRLPRAEKRQGQQRHR